MVKQKPTKVKAGGIISLIGFSSSPGTPPPFHIVPNYFLSLGEYAIPLWAILTLIGFVLVAVPKWDKDLN